MNVLSDIWLARFVVLFGGLVLASPLFPQQNPFPAECTYPESDETVFATVICPVGTRFFVDYFSPVAAEAAAQGGTIARYSLTVTGGSLPPGLTLTRGGVLSGTETTPGTYRATFTVSVLVTYANPAKPPFDLTVSSVYVFIVNPNTGPSTVIDPAGVSFGLTQGSAAATQSITIVNRTNQAQSFTAVASTNSGGNWLSVSPSSGSNGPFLSGSLEVSVNAAGLAAGTYSGQVSITTSPDGVSSSIPVLITVSSTQQSIVLSQTGLLFTAVQGGSSMPAQSISVLNGGSGSLNFSATASTLSGGNWLSVSPASGSSSPTSSGSVTVSVNGAGLAPGTYYGQIQFGSPGVANSPQTATIVLNVSSPVQSPGPSLSTTGLIFVAPGGGAAPQAQSVTIANPSPTPLTFTTTAFFDNGGTLFTVQPTTGSVTSTQTQRITVQPTTTGLKAGVYMGEVTIAFSDATTMATFQRRVAVVLIVTPSGGSTPMRDVASAPGAPGCTPGKLIPVFTQLGSNFQVAAGWPTALEVTVVDDCGAFLITGSVVTTFSSGDPALSLTSLKNGRWTGTWQPRSTASQTAVIRAQARQTQPPLQGTAQIGGQLAANTSVPIISVGGVVSAASNTPRQPLGPGSYIAIYGTNLSKGSNAAQALPLPTQIAGTQVILGGKPLPLNFAGNGQINAIVPFDVAVNTTQQLIVQQGTALSVPEPVVLSPAQPAVFTQDQSGKGLGVIVGYKADGSAQFLVDAAHPVSAGDTLVIYCTGLGPVDQSAVAAGSAGPSSPLANAVNTTTVRIGGQNAVVSYAGLAPTLAVYQVNVVVPNGVAPGYDVPLTMTVAGQQSVPVTIAVK